MRGHARDIGLQLKVVRESGYDLEIFDADGRTTYHGYMNEHNYDRHYIPWLPIKNGMYSLMAIGSVAALLYVSGDQELYDYLHDDLLSAERRLDWIYGHNQVGIDLWIWSNYSSYNMAFMGAWLAYRYLDDERARENAAVALRDLLYDKPMWHSRQPKLLKQSFFDFTVAGALAGSTAWSPMVEPPDAEAVARGVETLYEFKEPPFWDYATINCDDAEIASGHCLAADGVTELDIMPILGRGDKVVSQQVVPMHTRPPSNYYWRSNPYEVNGDGGVGGGTLLPGVDFRWAYWMGRWTR
jgi:hypothetical protein